MEEGSYLSRDQAEFAQPTFFPSLPSFFNVRMVGARVRARASDCEGRPLS